MLSAFDARVRKGLGSNLTDLWEPASTYKNCFALKSSTLLAALLLREGVENIPGSPLVHVYRVLDDRIGLFLFFQRNKLRYFST